MHARDIPTTIPTLQILPWSDPVIDQVGYDPRSRYVERFWLGILGPSSMQRTQWAPRSDFVGADAARKHVGAP
jgi:hypothetical protein